jgi:hypothetical protein
MSTMSLLQLVSFAVSFAIGEAAEYIGFKLWEALYQFLKPTSSSDQDSDSRGLLSRCQYETVSYTVTSPNQ